MAQYLQRVFTSPALNSSANATFSAATTHPIPQPSDMLSFLLSFSALQDWLRLFVIGGFFETCRRFFSYLYSKFNDYFFVTATFSDDDTSYVWMMAWLAKQPSWQKCRDVEISTGSDSSAAIILESNEANSSADIYSRKLTYLPSLSRTYSLWYKRRWVTITRIQQQGNYYNKEQTLHIRILTRSNRFLIDLLQEARNEYVSSQEHSVCIYVSDLQNNWRHVACRAKRSMNSVILDPGVKDLLLADAMDFMNSKEWYSERGIPFRRGYLLYGVPGSGKTSLIHSLAGALNLNVYIISLSRTGLDDSALDSLVNDLPEKCIALMEDIDAAFTNRLNRDEEPENEEAAKARENGAPPPPPSASRLSLSGLLNALDGVGAQEGRILIATTNKYASLDPALCRPGRMDLHIEFKNASNYQAKELFTRFYRPNDPEQAEAEKESADSDKESTDSGYSSRSENTESSDPPTPVNPESPSIIGLTHRLRSPRLSRSQLEKLSEQFSEAIPDRELSMASLQGYLMSYKIRPFEAVSDAAAWVQKERHEREAKEQKEKEAKEKKEKAKAAKSSESKEESKDKTSSS